MSDEINNDNELNEFQPEYGRKMPLRIFHSFEEMNKYDDEVRANTSGLQHLANVTFLLPQFFGDAFNSPMDLTIRFKNDERTTGNQY